MSNVSKEVSSGQRIWNSLEICKLAATIVTPMVVALFGWLIWSNQQAMVQRWERDQLELRNIAGANARERDRIREFRLSLYDKAAPLLNEILAYHFYVNRWKEHSPSDIIEKKRQLDALMYANIALFTSEFFDLYREFMRQGFRSARNHFGEPRIRTQAQCRHLRLGHDEPERWLSYFTHEDTRRDLCLAYVNLLGRLSEELLLQSLKMPKQTDAEKLSLCPPIYETARC